eukprot:8191842-Pyramimonas_sp.AAC.1
MVPSAFADDMSAMAFNIFRALPGILALFRLYGPCSGLVLNVKKCKLILCQNPGEEEVLRRFQEMGVDVSEFGIENM